jgi:hypothetical protein
VNTCGYRPYVTSSLTRGWIYRLQLLLALASAVILGSESRRTHDRTLLSQIRDCPNLDSQVPITGWPSYTPRHWVHFGCLLRLAGLRWKYSNPPPHGVFPSVSSDSAGLGSSLYSLGSVPTENTASWQFPCCYIGVFNSPLYRNGSSILACVFISAGTCLPSRCLAINVYPASTIPAFRQHGTLFCFLMDHVE